MPADGSITISTELDNKRLEKEYQRLIKKIEGLEEALSRKTSERNPLAEQAKQLAAELDIAKQKLHEMQTAVGGFSKSDIAEQKETVKAMQAEWSKVQARVDGYDRSIATATSELDFLKEKAGGIAPQLVHAGKESSRMGDAIDRAGKHMDKFTSRISKLVRNAFIFTVISKALSNLRDWTSKVIKTNEQATASIARLKGAWLTMVQPLVNVIIPAFIAIVNVLSRVLETIARLTSYISGTTTEESAAAADALHNQANAYDATGDAAKKASKQLAAFDEINQIGQEETAGADKAAGGIAPDFSAFDTEAFKDKISEFETYISGALLVLGAILTFSGVNIPLGLALLVAGAIGLVQALKEDWDKLPAEMQKRIGMILYGIAFLAIAIGVVLLFTGHFGIGLGLIVTGALALWAAQELGFSWDSVPPEIQRVVAIVVASLAIAAIVFGVIFLFTGSFGLGLGLIAAGALAFWGASELGFGWDTIPPEVQRVITSIMTILGGVAIAFGVIFLLTGHFGVGLGLIMAGAALLWGADALGFDWNSIPPEVQSIVTNVLAIIGPVAIAFGVIFLFTGSFGLGLALILIGAAALWGASELGFNWNAIPPEIQTIVTAVLLILGTAAVVFGAALLLTGHFGIGIALILIGAASLWGANALGFDWNAIPPEMRGTIETILTLISAAAIVLGVILLLTGNLPLGLALIGISAASYFGITKITDEATWGEVAKDVGTGLDDVEKEIRSHQGAFTDESTALGDALTDGTATAIKGGEKDVSDALTDTLEAGIRAGNQAMEIHSPSGVTQEQAGNMVKGWLLKLEEGIVSVGDATTEIMDALKAAVTNSQPDILRTFNSMFNSVLDSAETFANRYLTGLRDMLQQTASMMSELPNAPQISIPAISPVNIPRLAAGAVIPPNREFLAVLGDQKNGTNIEAPESLIRKIVREEAGRSGGNGNTTIVFDGDLAALARVLRPYILKENQRVGVNIVEGGSI